MLGRGFAVLCTALVSLLVAPVSGASQDWTATKPALNMQAALESGVPAKRPVTMLATKKGGTRLAVMTFRGGEFSPPVVAGDCYKVVAASEKVRLKRAHVRTCPHSTTHTKLSTEVRQLCPWRCSHTAQPLTHRSLQSLTPCSPLVAGGQGHPRQYLFLLILCSVRGGPRLCRRASGLHEQQAALVNVSELLVGRFGFWLASRTASHRRITEPGPVLRRSDEVRLRLRLHKLLLHL